MSTFMVNIHILAPPPFHLCLENVLLLSKISIYNFSPIYFFTDMFNEYKLVTILNTHFQVYYNQFQMSKNVALIIILSKS